VKSDRLKIAVYAIALNEEKHATRFCDSAKDADLIFVADTGSTDNTIKILQSWGVFVVDIRIKPWRFDDARNATLALLPDDVDVCVSLDLDEVLQPGWREEIERVWVPGTNRLRYGFDWGAGIQFQYEKIHARHGFRWHHPCHEFVVPDRTPEMWAHTDKLLVVHKPDPSKSRAQYLDLLRASVEEDPHCPRNAFYYARELSFKSQWQTAITEAKRYLELPRATWINERAYAMRVIAKCHQELGDPWTALTWLRRAAAEAPDTREPWCELAMLCHHLKRWSECFSAALMCLSITTKEKVYTVDPAVWGSTPHDLASIAAWNLGWKDIAIDHVRKAIELDPQEFRFRENLKLMLGEPTADTAVTNDAVPPTPDTAIVETQAA
jgi:tetratricopeptide (TPR) repeat protein